jgi:nucleoside-diphosphate-sugar epimerase
MKIGITGGTGFLGRYIVNHLLDGGHDCWCWYREGSDRGGFEVGGMGGPQAARGKLEWLEGHLGDDRANEALVEVAEVVVHAALERPGKGFRRAEGDMVKFTEANVLGTIQLIEVSRRAGVKRFIFISTCAVYDQILSDRPLDEAHPMWPGSHYGAHKAAIEEFVYSYGKADGYDICALRPTGIYGVARPVQDSKWYDLVQRVKRGEPIQSDKGGKEVHAADVAKAVEVLLSAPGIAGQAYNCYDMYISEEEVARIAQRLTGSNSSISSMNHGPQNQIITEKLRALGMTFGGRSLLEGTVKSLLSNTMV